MKRLIALSIAFALVAAAAFAQVSVGGSVVGRWTAVSSDGGDDSDLQTAWGMAPSGSAFAPIRARVNVTATNEEGNFGGWIQLRPGWGNNHYLSNVWWQPLDQVKLTLGYFWGGGNADVGVTFVNDDIITTDLWGRTGWKGDNYRGALNGWGYEVLSGTSLELFPIENLYIAITVPTGEFIDGWADPAKMKITDDNGTPDDPSDDTEYETDVSQKVSKANTKAEDVFAHTMGRIAYTIDGIGVASVTVVGGTGNAAGDGTRIAAGFTITAVENLGAYVGFEYPFLVTVNDVDYQDPMEVNLRASFNAGAFSVAGGVLLKFAGKTGDDDTPLSVGVTVNPAYALDILTIGLLGEVRFTNSDPDAVTEFHIVPYVQKPIGGGAIWAGVKINGSTVEDSNISWAIPVGFEYWF